MWLTRLALRNPVLILMLTLAVSILGVTALNRLAVDLFPNINLPVLRVGTLYPGAGPRDVERSITYPIERAVSGLPNLMRIESASKEGVSIVSAYLNWGADIDAAMVEGANGIQQIINTLPSGVQVPFILKFDLSNIPVCSASISASNLDERALYDLAVNIIEPQIEQLPGVASASVNGGKIRQINAIVDRERMAAMGLSLLDVVSAINGANLIEPAGWLKVGAQQYQVATNSQLRVVDRIGDVVVAKPRGIPVRISDLGRVVDGSEQQTNIVRVNGRRGVYLAVNKQPGANTVEVVDYVRQAIKQLIGIPKNLRVSIRFDQSKYIRDSIDSLRHEALQGALLALIVILVFIQSLRGTLIIALAIPVSILATLLLLFLAGQTLNIFTLGGIALAVGRMVDDSIVELENVSRHFSRQGISRKAVLDAAHEVRMPVLASTITTVIVFLPTLFVTGMARILFIPTALAVTCSLVASYLVSTTATPLLCLRFLQPETPISERRGVLGWVSGLCRRGVDLLEASYRRSLDGALRRRALVIVAVTAVALGSLLLVRRLGVEFFPATDESQFQITVRAPIGTGIEQTERWIAAVEKEIEQSVPAGWVQEIDSNIGLLSTAGRTSARSAAYSQNTGPHAAIIQIYLVNPDKRSLSADEIMDRLRPRLARNFPQLHFYMSPGGLVTRVLNFGYGAPIDVEELGYDLGQAATLAKQVSNMMNNVRGVADVQVTREENFPEFDVNLDRQKAALAGIYEYNAAHLLLASTNGSTQSPSIYIDPTTGNEYNIVAQYDESYIRHYGDLGETFLVNPLSRGDHLRNQGVVKLKTIASIVPGAGPLEIDRRYLQRVIDISANPVGRDLGSIAADLSSRFASLKVPPGFSLKLGGQIAQQRATFKSLAYATVLAVALVYMVLAAQFQSLSDPFIVMLSVPLGGIGTIWALFLTGTRFSTPAFMGVIMMVGIVVSNGVLLIHYANLLREQGRELHAAVLDACVTRLRPIVMTTVATLAGLLPMAMGLEIGSESNAPLARAVIGGLAVSTCLTLFFVPVLYSLIEERVRRNRIAPR